MGKRSPWLVTAFAGLSMLVATRAPAATCIADKPPNPQPASSQPVPPMFCLTGAVGQHYYLWNIPVAASGRVWTVKLESLPGEEARLLIQSLDRDPHKGLFNFKTLWQGAGNGKTSSIASPDLPLKPGLYGIAVATRQPPGLFRLFVASQKAPAPSSAIVATSSPALPVAATPPAATPPAATSTAAVISSAAAQITDQNNTTATALVTAPGASISGMLPFKNGSRDSQFVALALDNSWTNKRFDLVLRTKGRSEGLDFAFVGADGSDAEIRSGTNEVRLPRLTFAPGKYVFRVSAVPTSDLPYALSVENIAPTVRGQEYEPNDTPALADPIPDDGMIAGAADGDLDNDYFRFRSSGPPKLWRITCSCANADRLTVQGGDGGDLISVSSFPGGQAQISGVLFAAGDHILRVRGSKGHYVLHVVPQAAAPLEAGGPPAPLSTPLGVIDEIEPNDNFSFAMPLALNSSRGGLNDHAGDVDYYRFTLLGPTRVRLTLTSPGADRDVTLGRGSGLNTIVRSGVAAGAKAPMVWEGSLTAADYYVVVSSAESSGAPYRIKLETLDPFTSPGSHRLGLDARLALDVSRVAAHAIDGQTVRGHLSLSSSAATPLDLTVAGYVADERWSATTDRSSVHLAPGAKISLPVTVRVSPDAWADHPVDVAFGLHDKSGAHVTATAIISPEISAAEVAPSPVWEIPASLAGGLNMAWSALGGKSLDNHPQLIDGLINAGGTMQSLQISGQASLEIALGGNAAVHLVGFVLVQADSNDRLRHFRILASADGKQFTQVFSGALSPRAGAQYFVLPKPIDARALRLVPIDSQNPTWPFISLAEFGAIADPSSTLPGQGGLEISPILRGGHVVQIDPYPYGDSQTMLSATATRSSEVPWPSTRKEPLSWVIAFLDDRPARVESIAWQYATDQSPRSAISSVDVLGSLTSPNGPWVKLGTWKISPAGNSEPFHPAGAPPLRYLRFVAAATWQESSVNLPLHLSIHEIPIAKTYHSVLALPVRQPRPAAISSFGSGGGLLLLNKPVRGIVQLGVKSDHWTLDLPPGTKTATLTLANSPALGATLSMKSAKGARVEMTEQMPAADTRRYSAAVGPGRYEVDVSEPPRSIALLWDTSGSVSGWTPTIIAAVRSITQDAVPGRDEINLFPFHDPVAQPLLKAYSGEPADLFSALQAYDWKDSSSGAEGALIGALQTLRNRQGRRGIIILTDAETSSADMTPQLWPLIAQIRPQIFTLIVSQYSSGESAWKSRNLMTDWAAATGGFNSIIGDQGGTQAAFQRAAATLRGWMPYTLTATVSTTPPPLPSPGTLAVTFAPLPATAKSVARDAVALLLDASGSMLQTIEGRRKIDIARSELDHLVRDVIPAGTPMTLRVYGQGGRGSCRSDLMIPLEPLDRAQAEAVVAKVRSTDGAKTATAASLRATVEDLAAAQGQRHVILITDGEENCGGNVESEIAALKKSGFDVQLDIVGFAIDAPQTAQTFARWARLGGGKYFEASDATTLDNAMRAAMKRQFEAVDSEGRIVASGDVGGSPVTIPPGHYTVRLHGQANVSVTADIKPKTVTTAVLRQ